MSSERGNVSVIAVAGVGLALILCLGVARVGSAVVLKARADNAADAAALAGADALALGHSASVATHDARVAASENGARLLECACSGDVAEVTVVLAGEVGRGAWPRGAEVDLSRAPALAP